MSSDKILQKIEYLKNNPHTLYHRDDLTKCTFNSEYDAKYGNAGRCYREHFDDEYDYTTIYIWVLEWALKNIE